MHVTETLNEGLRRQFRVVVPAAILEQQLTEKLAEMGSRAQIRGFRRGKVPVNHLRRLYGRSMMADVIQKQVENSSRDALAERNVKPAYPPEIALPEGESEVSGIIDGTYDLSFTMRTTTSRRPCRGSPPSSGPSRRRTAPPRPATA